MNKIPKRFPTKFGDRFLASTDGVFATIIQIEMEFDYPLDEKRLAKAVALTMDAEPILGCKFVPRFMRSYWERVETGQFDIFILTEIKSGYEAFKNKKIDSYSGPQMFVCLHRSESFDKLIIKISHLPSDAAGVKDVAAIMSTIYNNLADNPDYNPDPNIKSCRSLRHVIKHVPWYAYPQIVLNFLKNSYACVVPYKTHNVSIINIPEKSSEYVVRHIAKEKVDNLIEYIHKFDATINDIFLAAIFRALSKLGEWSNEESLRLGTTVDLRRYIPTKKADSISNFSTVEIITYGTNMENDFESVLIHVRDKMNKEKSSWLGLNSYIPIVVMLWTLPFPWLKKFLATTFSAGSKSPNATDLFTNIGDIPADCVYFGGNPTRAWILPPGCDLPILFFALSGYNGSLSLSTRIVPHSINEITANNFFDLLLSELPL